MKHIKNRLFIAFFIFTMLGCVAAPPSEAVYVSNYKHRIVKVNPVVHGRTITVRVHHTGSLTSAERNDLIRWYKNKHHRPHHSVKVTFIRH